MTQFDARKYWPTPGQGRTLTNTFSSEIVQTYTDEAVGNYRLRQVINGKWDCDWFYRLDPMRGVLEYRDDYPKNWYNYLELWKKTREVWCLPGKEIFWGGPFERTGAVAAKQCVTSGPLGQYGWQEIFFNAILPTYVTKAGTFENVLVLTYWQQWGGGKIDGAKMWLAPGLGQIRAEWMLNEAPTGYWMELLETKEERN